MTSPLAATSLTATSRTATSRTTTEQLRIGTAPNSTSKD